MARMHTDEVNVGGDHLVRKLVGAQLPEWADLPDAAATAATCHNLHYRLNTLATRVWTAETFDVAS